MKILFIEWNSFGNEDIKEAFAECGHNVFPCQIDDKEILFSPAIKSKIKVWVSDYNPDIIFNFNYFPEIASVCHELGIKYISWVYDNPYVLLYSATIIYPTNYVFVFDKTQFYEFQNNRIPTVYYLPLAANTKRISAQLSNSDLRSAYSLSKWKTRYDIAFIGSLYTENHQFFHRLEGINDYTRGYLEGIINSQRLIYGDNFIDKVLSKEIIAQMQKFLPLAPNPTGCETEEYLFAQYVINRQITSLERTDFLSSISQIYGLDLYTGNSSVSFKNCLNHGKIDYYDMAPFVYQDSKISINITLRSIHSGIPLRAFDILGAGGFLLSNYQADFSDCYIAGEDYIYFDSKEDMMFKIDYYMNHEKERTEIARNGYIKTCQEHTYLNRISEMLNVIK